MNKNMMIHESDFKMLFDLIAAFSDFRKDNNKANDKDPMRGMSSLAKAVSKMTLTFPVICSRGIDIETASMISKAMEKNFVSMLQRMFAAYQISSDADLMSYVQKFHNNVSDKIVELDDIYGLEDIIKSLNDSTMEPMTGYEIACMMEAMRQSDYVLPTDINEISLRNFMIHEGAATLFTDEELKNRRDTREERRDSREARAELRDIEKNRRERDNQAGRARKDAVDYFAKQVPDSEYKKANELMPTNMIVNFTVKDNKGKKLDEFKSGVVGIKAKLYPVASDDVVKHIAERNASNNWLTNLFRASTKEISFMKDFVFALDKAKTDAMSMSTRNPTSDKMWKVLERRATVSKLNKAMKSNNSAAAISTLVISQEEVEYLRKYHSVDVERLAVVRGLLDTLNLIAVVIVDETLEVAKFCFDDGENMWETISFNHLQRETSNGEYKKVINMMTKAR